MANLHILPPVPDSLRALAQRQLARPDGIDCSRLADGSISRTLSQHLRHFARLQRNMQEIMLERTKPIHALTQAANSNPGEWSHQLMQFDHSRQNLRAAYDAHEKTIPVVAQALATWRAQQGIDPGRQFTHEQDDDELVLYLLPQVCQVRVEADALLRQALEKWGKATTNYFHLLKPSPHLAAA